MRWCSRLYGSIRCSAFRATSHASRALACTSHRSRCEAQARVDALQGRCYEDLGGGECQGSSRERVSGDACHGSMVSREESVGAWMGL